MGDDLCKFDRFGVTAVATSHGEGFCADEGQHGIAGSGVGRLGHGGLWV